MSNLFKGAALFVGGAIVGAVVASMLSPEVKEEIRQKCCELLKKEEEKEDGK